MKIRTLREWLDYKKGQVGTATNREATIGELMEVVKLILDNYSSDSN